MVAAVPVVRTSMAALVSRTRRYIGDKAGATEYFADQEIQDELDLQRHVIRYGSLRPEVTISTNGLYNYADYYSIGIENWEDDYVLQWGDYSPLTATLSEPITGHWQFSNGQPGGQYPPVWITGKFYDCHGAAADLLEQWAAGLATTAYNFVSDRQSFSRGQIIPNMQRLADNHRAQSMPRSTHVRRNDIARANDAVSLDLGGLGDVVSQ